MNYLAHIFLSGSNKQIQIGNFIGDAVKGKRYKNYPQAISDGILLHRAIDSYTDNHHIVKETIKLLKPDFGRYSGVVLDIYFDYLLASRFDEFSNVPLKKFTRKFYLNMILKRRYLPERIKRFMWHFIWTDRLYKYSLKDGIRLSLEIMVNVRKMDISVEMAMEFLDENQDELWNAFRLFFNDIEEFCKDFLNADNREEYFRQL